MRKSFARSLFVLSTLILSSLLASAWAGSSTPMETVMQEGFDVAPGGTLRVDVPDADLNLKPGGANRVEIEVRLGAKDMEWARERFEAMNFRASGGGREVVLQADRLGSGLSWRRGGFWISVEILLPEEFDVDLSTGDGDIRVESVRGRLEVSTGDGDVVIERASGAEVSIQTGDGDILVTELSAAEIRIHTSDGDVRSERLDGDQIEIRTGDGDIGIDNVSGELSVSTGDGDIRVGLGDRFGETSLETGDGDITIRAPAALQATVDLRGADVVLGADDAFDGSRRDHSARGTLNGGGPTLHARTSDGTVVMRVRDDG